MTVGPHGHRHHAPGRSSAAVCAQLLSAAAGLKHLVDEADQDEPTDVDLLIATHAIHRALVALRPTSRSLRASRLVGLTVDEAAVAIGVIELLGPDPNDQLDELAQRTIDVLRERMQLVGAPPEVQLCASPLM